MFGLSDEIDKTLSEIRRYSPDDIESAPKALRASILALSQIKDYISNSDVIASLPSSFQPLFKFLLQELSMAETQIEIVEGLISKYYILDESKSDATTAVSRERVLSSPKSSSKKGKTNYDLGISQADYHLRARSRVMQTHHNIDNAFMNPDLPLSDQIHGIFRMTSLNRISAKAKCRPLVLASR